MSVSGHDSPKRAGADTAGGSTVERSAPVPSVAAGQRFDQALAGMFPEFSRARLTAWIKAGSAVLDGVTVPPRHRVHGGEWVKLRAQLEAQVAMRAQPLTLDIRYRDEDLLVLVKPAGLVVHPGAGNADGTLQNALLHLDASVAELPRAGIVHRLDKQTSGLMVVACSLRAHTALVAMLSGHEVARQYQALVTGHMIAGGTVDAPLGRHPRDRLRRTVREGDAGKRAVTHYRVRERYPAHTLLQCRLETGRTHQIRVHLAHIGHPLVGDPVYGGGLKLPRGATPQAITALRGFRRQALHAERLAFAHPVSGQALSFDAECPADMQALLTALRDGVRAF